MASLGWLFLSSEEGDDEDEEDLRLRAVSKKLGFLT